MAALSPLTAWLWKNEELSDVTVQLCTTQKTVVPQRSGKAKAARRGTPSVSATTAASTEPYELDEYARSYPCHASILASCSPSYFRTRVTRGNSSSGGGDGSGLLLYADSTATAPGQAAPRSLLLQEHVEEGELDAMEAVLRSCYTGQLCDEGADAAHLSVEALLQMVVLCDRFDVSLTLLRCCDELVNREASAYTAAAVDCVLGNLPPGVESHAAHSRIIAAATECLLQRLGNVEAVCGAWYDPGSSLDSQLLHLPLPSLLALLSSNKLAARSENSVLMMAEAWVAGPEGSACSQQQLRQVAEVIRLGQLSPSFTVSVLHHLPWLQLSSPERDSLLQYSVTGMTGGAHRQAQLYGFKQLSGPAAWYDAKQRAAWEGPADVTVQWTLTPEQLTNHLTHARSGDSITVDGPGCFFNGYTVSPALYLNAEPAPGLAWVGHTVTVQQGESTEDAELCIHCMSIPSTAAFEISGQPGSRAWRGALPSGFISHGRQPRLATDSQVLDIASWAPLLVQGKLELRCTISACG